MPDYGRKQNLQFFSWSIHAATGGVEKAQSQMLNYEESGMSVMEMSHRSKAYDAIITKTQERMRSIMNIPDNYKVLFLQGGATSQFSMVPPEFVAKGYGRLCRDRIFCEQGICGSKEIRGYRFGWLQ